MRARPTRQTGFSLLEVLITMVVVALGLLGFAGLQTYSLKSNRVSMQRSLATLHAYSIVDSMRANRAAAASYVQAFADTPACPADAPAVTGVVATDDMARWNQAVACDLPSGQGDIAVNGNTVTVSVRWRDGTTAANSWTTWSTSTSL